MRSNIGAFFALVFFAFTDAAVAAPFAGPVRLPSYWMGTTLPPNNLHLRQSLIGSGLTEAQFNEIIDHVIGLWQPVAKARRLTIVAGKKWDEPAVNAGTFRNGDYIVINIYGGLARAPEQTADGFALVLCHELGHGFGGYPFVGGGGWYSNEGEADYFASLVCAKQLWGADVAGNAKFRSLPGVPTVVQASCARAWLGNPAAQAWCLRTAAAAQALVNVFHAADLRQPSPHFETPDHSAVSVTFDEHPASQCRLDTYFAGALCGKAWDLNVVPGLNAATPLQAEADAFRYSCSGHEPGARPACWFHQLGR